MIGGLYAFARRLTRKGVIMPQQRPNVPAQTEGWFAIRVTASNNSNKTAVSTVRCRYDNQAPDKVTELTATDEGSGGAIRLNFTASTSPDSRRSIRTASAGIRISLPAI